jgi:hypothetical protein
MNALTAHHAALCPEFAAAVGVSAANPLVPARRVEEIPFLHVGLFKRMKLATSAPDNRTVRTVLSSSTSGTASRIQIDEKSSRLQSKSAGAILHDFIGGGLRPLLVLDSVQSLRMRDEFSARVMAAMSLKPFATEIFFLLKDPADPASLQIKQLECALKPGGDLLVYGFSWMLWAGWCQAGLPEEIRAELRSRRIFFVHSGGWKKLEHAQVPRTVFDQTLLADAAPGSLVLDYYGLVEQMGVIFPLCPAGSRHVPRWADVIVRDSWTGEPLAEGEGQLQLLNVISWGTPCHSVLTEDMGRLLPGVCACGRQGRRFELLGRVPRAEIRGCANV